MSGLKPPNILFHDLFREYDSDPEELMSCAHAFLDGDCGIIVDEDEVLGFMKRSLEGALRHGAYRIKTAGLIHVLGDDKQVTVLPDIVFSDITRDCTCSANTCTCIQDKYDVEVQG